MHPRLEMICCSDKILDSDAILGSEWIIGSDGILGVQLFFFFFSFFPDIDMCLKLKLGWRPAFDFVQLKSKKLKIREPSVLQEFWGSGGRIYMLGYCTRYSWCLPGGQHHMVAWNRRVMLFLLDARCSPAYRSLLSCRQGCHSGIFG